VFWVTPGAPPKGSSFWQPFGCHCAIVISGSGPGRVGIATDASETFAEAVKVCLPKAAFTAR